jgi:hypothetical protein
MTTNFSKIAFTGLVCASISLFFFTESLQAVMAFLEKFMIHEGH